MKIQTFGIVLLLLALAIGGAVPALAEEEHEIKASLIDTVEGQKVEITFEGEAEEDQGIFFLAVAQEKEDDLKVLYPEYMAMNTAVSTGEDIILSDDFDGTSYSFPSSNLIGNGKIYVLLSRTNHDLSMGWIPYWTDSGKTILGEVKEMEKINIDKDVASDDLNNGMYFTMQEVPGFGGWAGIYADRLNESKTGALATFIEETGEQKLISFRDDALTLGDKKPYTLAREYEGQLEVLYCVDDLPKTQGYVYSLMMDTQGMRLGIAKWRNQDEMWWLDNYYVSEIV